MPSAANPNIQFELIFNDLPYPANPDDTIGRRSALLIVIASDFVEALERSSQPDAVLPGFEWIANRSPRLDRSPWGKVNLERTPDGADLKLGLQKSNLGLATHISADGDVTILLQTGEDIYARPIPAATPLLEGFEIGPGAEEASLLAASSWGMPDFVMRPKLVRKGEGSWEVGDGTVVVGKRGLAIQVKAGLPIQVCMPEK